eukprot:scaffold4911_cov100-Cylindrotheca_fusiformis.AAC.2
MCKSNHKCLLATSTRRNETDTTATAMKTHHQHHHGSPSSSSWKTLVAKDDSLLLKACLNYAWKDVIQCCSTLLSMLLLEESMSTESSCKALSPYSTSSFQELIQSQLSKRDPWGNTPLLAACHYDPPVVVVQMLLILASEVSMEIHTAVNSTGASPLVVFCSSSAGRRGRKTLAIVSLLLRQERNQPIPLSSLTDDHGNSVFQGLLTRYQMLRKIPKFSNVCCTSLDDVSTTLQEEEQENCDLGDGEVLLDTFWTTIRFLIQAASRPGWTLLHGAAHMAPLLPPEITRFILRYHYSQQQEQVEEKDEEKEDGENANIRPMPPLHSAVSSYAALHGRENINHSALRTWRNQTEYFVQQLLVADPLAAITRHPQHGRLPWTQAIAAGFSWNSATTTTITAIDDDEKEDQKSSLMQRLLQAHPPALEEQDPVTGLDPVVLAATNTATVPATLGRCRPCSDKTMDQLDTVVYITTPGFVISQQMNPKSYSIASCTIHNLTLDRRTDSLVVWGGNLFIGGVGVTQDIVPVSVQ